MYIKFSNDKNIWQIEKSLDGDELTCYYRTDIPHSERENVQVINENKLKAVDNFDYEDWKYLLGEELLRGMYSHTEEMERKFALPLIYYIQFIQGYDKKMERIRSTLYKFQR